MERRGLSYDKGCYVGQETVARIRSIGHVNRQLTVLSVEEGTLPALPAGVRVGEAEAGTLTSAAHSPLLGKTVALGMISRKHHQPGTILHFEGGHGTVISPPRIPAGYGDITR